MFNFFPAPPAAAASLAPPTQFPTPTPSALVEIHSRPPAPPPSPAPPATPLAAAPAAPLAPAPPLAPGPAALLAAAPEVSATPSPPQSLLHTFMKSLKLFKPTLFQPSLCSLQELLLPQGWKQSLPKEQHAWVSRALFMRDQAGRPVLKESLQLWWYPPEPRPIHHNPPSSPAAFFLRPLFLWMPYRLWAFKLVCTQPQCRGQKLSGAGLYRTVRRVLDIDGWYYMATEYLECRRCRKKVAGWSRDVLDQLDPAHREEFPAILTYRLVRCVILTFLIKPPILMLEQSYTGTLTPCPLK